MVPSLKVIIVLPVAPEEVNEIKTDPVTEHGLFLQHEVLTALKKSFRENIGIYSMIEPAKSSKERESKTDLFGSQQVYVHNKCLIVDDVFASISSANTNARSFRLDTELGVAWFDSESVSALRLRLWNELLGSPNMKTWAVKDYVKQWEAIAQANKNEKDFKKRKGFVVPHDPDRKELRGQRMSLGSGLFSIELPEEFADLLDGDRGVATDEIAIV